MSDGGVFVTGKPGMDVIWAGGTWKAVHVAPPDERQILESIWEVLVTSQRGRNTAFAENWGLT